MTIDTFMRVTATGLNVDAVAAAYAAWALGDESARSRTFRLNEGVQKAWTAKQLLASASLVGAHGCRIDTRIDTGRMLFRFVHRDTTDGAVFWQVSARVQAKGNGVTIEHAVGRDAPRDHYLTPIASPSRVVLGLVDRDGVRVSPKDLVVPLVTVAAPDAARFVDHVLLRNDRDLPVVVVACDRAGAPPLVDVARLADRLRGICGVAVLPTEAATYAFGDALDARGYGAEFRCFHGAVHSYGPTKTLRLDHRLWLGESLRSIDPRTRADHVAGLLAQRIAVRETPGGFFTLIEDFDGEERRIVAKRLSEKRSTPPPPSNVVSAEYHAKVEAERAELQAALTKSLQAEEASAALYTKADDELRAAEQARDDIESKLEQERSISSELREQLQRAKERVKGQLEGEDLAAVRALAGSKLTPAACLRLLTLTYGDRVVVLQSAFDSAEDSSNFRHSDKLLELLHTLATTYWEAIGSGKGDGQAAKALGSNFAAIESETTMSNKRAIRERSFKHTNGDTLVMWRHLKIGVAETTSETIRVHFDWVASEKKIVIGWCGEHRHRVG